MSLSVAIMAHPKREAQVRHVMGEVGDVTVVWDRINDRWDTGKRAMLAYDASCSHHLVIQDDVLPCRDLLAGVEEAMKHVDEGCPLCLYIGRRRPKSHVVARAAKRAETMGAAFLTMRTLNWGPGIVVPTAAIPDMIAFSDRLTAIKNYDRRLSRYWELKAKLPVWYTWPSLLDHADGPSLVKGRIGTDREANHVSRIAHRFIGEDVSALDLDWGGPVLDLEGPYGPQNPSPAPQKRLTLEDVDGDEVAFRNTITGQVRKVPKASSRVRRFMGLKHWQLVSGGEA